MQLDEIVRTSLALRETRSRRRKVALLADCLRRLSPDEIRVGVAYLCGALPQGRIGLGWAALREARPVEAADAARLGVREADAAFSRIAAASGAGSGRARARELAALLGRATGAEQEFLGRLVLGELRQGASEGLVVESLADAAGVPAADVRRARMLAGDLGAVAEAALLRGRAGLSSFALELFRPLLPMLAQPAQDLAAALGRLGEAAFEWKLDGARIQVHKLGGDVRVFSRRLHDVTAAVPEVVEVVRSLPPRVLILDGEAIALRSDGKPLPFQTTMRRFGRRLDVAGMRDELPLSCLFFDCLHLDGKDLLERPAVERAALLAEALPPPLRVPRLVSDDAVRAERFFDEALARGHEGLMAKSLAAPYEAGGRGQSWLKLKPAHTLDLVVLAAEWGSGRRRGWLSNLHLGARDPARGGFVMLGKTFKGLTDEVLAWQTARLLELEVGRDDYTVHVRPELVVEIAFSDVQASPHYPAGLALRFARVKGYRPDKRPEQADAIDAVRAIHARATAP